MKTNEHESESDFSFQWTINGNSLERLDDVPLLGRDNRYRLNVKTVSSDGRPLAGIVYYLNVEDPDSLGKYFYSVSGLGDKVVSTSDGNNFEIFAGLRSDAANFEHTNFRLNLVLSSDSGVTESIKYAVGRLAYWGAPTVFADNANIAFRAKIEWAGEGNAGYWDWDSHNITQSTMRIESLEISSTSGFIDRGVNGEVLDQHMFSLNKFKGQVAVKIDYETTFSQNGYTGILPKARVVKLPE